MAKPTGHHMFHRKIWTVHAIHSTPPCEMTPGPQNIYTQHKSLQILECMMSQAVPTAHILATVQHHKCLYIRQLC